ncbi:MAG: hypothetical protein ABIV63_06305, partial [Caldimonas sp.]
FELRGLGSLDFMLQGDEFSVFEVNARPPATTELYGARYGRNGRERSASDGPLSMHVLTCGAGLHAELPFAALAADEVEVRPSDALDAATAATADAGDAANAGNAANAADKSSAGASGEATTDALDTAAAKVVASAERASSADAVGGVTIVYAQRSMLLDLTRLQRLAKCAGCHDLPSAPSRFKSGDPVCSVGAVGSTAEQVRLRLARLSVQINESMGALHA